MKTRQEIFDIVATHLLKQNECSFNEGEGCMYRGSYGLKCAIGVLIPAELYKVSMEGGNIVELFRIFPHIMKNCGLDINDFDFLGGLQAIHDNNLTEVWKSELYSMAKKHSLDIKSLEE